jgi:hypothetical protein
MVGVSVGPDLVNVKVGPDGGRSMGEAVGIAVDRARLHLFDGDGDRRSTERRP